MGSKEFGGEKSRVHRIYRRADRWCVSSMLVLGRFPGTVCESVVQSPLASAVAAGGKGWRPLATTLGCRPRDWLTELRATGDAITNLQFHRLIYFSVLCCGCKAG
ncbi:hypothetical protein WA026_003007 [Henosepilachna vigintioctopunctata]|uniref:Uncharacterized protein n=1 Tax=Henosepilachna vigintioctopunctata TaxID=420089 RepID=A0AAW1TM81_9CUCU